MIDPIAAGTSAAAARPTPATTTNSETTHGGASFAGELSRYVAKSPTTTKAPVRPQDEKTTKVKGHPYARVENGPDKGIYLNQLAGNPREGRVFKLLERDDHVFHIYGTGRDRVIVEVKSKSQADATSGASSTGSAKTST